MWTSTEEAGAAGGASQRRESGGSTASASRNASQDNVGGRISKSIVIEGSISGEGDLYVEGRVKGSIELKDNVLTIGPDGVVEAEVGVRHIAVHGRLGGSVHGCERIEISKTGTVEGEIVAGRIAVEDGAIFRGTVNIEEPARKAVKATPQKAETAEVREPAATAQKRKPA